MNEIAKISVDRRCDRAPGSVNNRCDPIDVVRGLAMAFMALDHTRDYFTLLSFEPEVLAKTYGAVFFTRWITHFCAPAFFLLAGSGAYLYGLRNGTARLKKFLWTRGLWLIFLEFTLVGTAWTFQFPGGFFGVLWCLGSSMALLSLFIRFRPSAVGVVSVAIICFHDLFDRIRPAQFRYAAPFWSMLHVAGPIGLGPLRSFVLFPLIPWVAVMGVGYWLGTLYRGGVEERRNILKIVGYICTAMFILLRLTNAYGNPPVAMGGVSQGDWHPQPTVGKTLILFFDVEKYPPSLQYLLMTIGPLLLLLSAISEYQPKASNPLIIFGRVPLFFYVLHLFLIHSMAVIVAYVTHQPVMWLLHGAFFRFDLPVGYGHGLPFIYFCWALALAILYIPCARFVQLKKNRQHGWLSYL